MKEKTYCLRTQRLQGLFMTCYLRYLWLTECHSPSLFWNLVTVLPVTVLGLACCQRHPNNILQTFLCKYFPGWLFIMLMVNQTCIKIVKKNSAQK